jgi:hypothetical protein
MREAARGDLASPVPPSAAAREIVRADAGDTCARVVFVVQPPAHVWLTDAHGDVLADVASTADSPLGAKGPVCVRRGDAIALHVDAAVPWTGRFVAWASP